MRQLLDARLNRESLSLLADKLPEELVDQIDKDGYKNKLLQQAQLALICYDAGLSVSCDLNVDDSEAAVRIRPGHVHDAMRRLAGVDQHPNAADFPLDAEQLDLFS